MRLSDEQWVQGGSSLLGIFAGGRAYFNGGLDPQRGERNKMQPGEREEFERKIAQEAEHWGSYTREALKQGIPTWVDVRNASSLRGFAHVFGDPVTERLLRGVYKERLIRAATTSAGRVLDLGCGAGWLSLELARHGMEVHGVDVSPGQIEVAREYLDLVRAREHQQLKILYEVGDLNSLNLAQESYVAIVSWDALHHIWNLDHLSSQMDKALVPGGKVITFEHVGSPLLSNFGRPFERLEGSSRSWGRVGFCLG